MQALEAAQVAELRVAVEVQQPRGERARGRRAVVEVRPELAPALRVLRQPPMLLRVLLLRLQHGLADRWHELRGDHLGAATRDVRRSRRERSVESERETEQRQA